MSILCHHFCDRDRVLQSCFTRALQGARQFSVTEVVGQTDVGLLRGQLEHLTGVEGEGEAATRVRQTLECI